MNKEFEGKYAVVTGGAGGISYEAAKTLAKKGLAVVEVITTQVSITVS